MRSASVDLHRKLKIAELQLQQTLAFNQIDNSVIEQSLGETIAISSMLKNDENLPVIFIRTINFT